MRERIFSWLSFLRFVQYGASVLAVDAEGRVLLVKHRLRGGWEWPAGGGKLGELPDQAAIREIREEAGIEAANPKLVAVYARKVPGLATRLNFTFAVRVNRDQAASAAFDRLELTALRWVTLDEAERLVSPRLRRRFLAAVQAWQTGQVVYLAGHKEAP